MTRYHNIEQESAANLNEWQTMITNVTKFEQFTSNLGTNLLVNPTKMLYFNNQYVLFTTGKNCYVSTNLTDWEEREINTSASTFREAFILGGYLYCISGSYGFRTTDLITWTRGSISGATYTNHAIPLQDSTNMFFKLTNSDKKGMILKISSTFSTTSSYTNEFRSETGATTEIIYAGDRYFFANLNSPYCYYSFDATNWVEVKLPFEVDNGINANVDVAGSTDRYYITGNNIDHIYYTSDFKTWKKVNVAGSKYDGIPHLFYHPTLQEMIGVHGMHKLWFQEETPIKFTLVGPDRDSTTTGFQWKGMVYNGEKYIVWYATMNQQYVYFATISDAYKDTNLSYVLSMLLQKMDETNTKLQALIDKE